MKWEVHITGDQSTLEDLARSLTGNDPTIRHQGNGYVLHSKTFDPISDAHALRQETDRILTSLSGAARLLLGTDKPLQVSHIEQVHKIHGVKINGVRSCNHASAKRFEKSGLIYFLNPIPSLAPDVPTSYFESRWS